MNQRPHLVEQFDKRMDEHCKVLSHAEELRRLAKRMEQRALADFGIKWVNREAGFPCWTHDDLAGYFNNPRQVVEALAKRAKCTS